MFSPADLTALSITLKLAALSTAILLLIGTPLAWWLAHGKHWFTTSVGALIALPLVLPPTVLGFYLLLLLGANGPFSSLSLAFSFTGLVIGSVVYSLPFVVQPLQNSFATIDRGSLEAAATLGASPLDRFVSIIVPLCKRGFISASILGFAHTVGEFGVVLMIGGNIAGETQVASIAIYDHVESMDYAQAHLMSATLLLMSFCLLLLVYAGRKPHGVFK